ncbi:MAG: F0F1 ATP synthase subunit gamma [Paludibacteraceae bacterium]
MASLKEVKARIGSVSSTKKITGAMKMVSSAKLKKAQGAIESIAPYQERLNRILNNFLETETDFQSAFAEVRPLKKLAIVVFSSNSSLCGAFNSNAIKRLNEVIAENKKLGTDNIIVFPVGKKIHDAVKKLPVTIGGEYQQLADKPNFGGMSDVTNSIMERFVSKEFDKVTIIYHHSKSTSVQQLLTEDFLPITFDKKDDVQKSATCDYIVEPGKREVLEALLPKALRTKLYACLLDSNASEHGARVVAMQTATDNADDLINDLTILYNKTRQQAITNELLDIMGGAAALSK